MKNQLFKVLSSADTKKLQRLEQHLLTEYSYNFNDFISEAASSGEDSVSYWADLIKASPTEDLIEYVDDVLLEAERIHRGKAFNVLM
jgi:hypothetical protein